jgi:hypothetical protein
MVSVLRLRPARRSLVAVTAIGLVLPLLAIVFVKTTRFRSV